ncbi:hypothetical protein CRYUN_Cryun06bG0070200 [Craigia yunnanensis]
MISLGKRKRGRKPKVQFGHFGEEREGLEIVNKNSVTVDLAALSGLEDPYGQELKRRTEGIVGNEEALLGFMRDLGVQWSSRRRKRKIVDASIFGDMLPIGWKLLLGLKMRKQECAIQKEGDQRQSAEHEKEVNLLGMDNLAEVQIHDLFECHKCNMTFDEKDAYLQHHRTTRRYRLGSSIGDGTIGLQGARAAHEDLQNGCFNEIAQNSILETITAVPRYELNDGSSLDKLNAVSNPEIPASTSDHEMNSNSLLSESRIDDDTTNRTLNQDLCQQTSKPMVIDERTKKINEASNF